MSATQSQPVSVSKERVALHRSTLLRHVATAAVLPAIAVVLPFGVAILLLAGALTLELVLFGVWNSGRLFLVRFTTAAIVVIGAAFAPLAEEDIISVNALPTTPTTVRELNARIRSQTVHAWPLRTESDDALSLSVTFSAPEMSLRQYIDEIAQQTGRQPRLGRCATDASILFGASPMGLLGF